MSQKNYKIARKIVEKIRAGSSVDEQESIASHLAVSCGVNPRWAKRRVRRQAKNQHAAARDSDIARLFTTPRYTKA